ncbi:MAG: hypothetical protein LAKADJCE_00362 [Candidatus Argoarchaeum ethanivorans]|uniref:Uncharacterized protein n=1 Tax=Candidatus Argoarchaeum ethanivorans TaxID=2608793 RepID=A0A811TAA9_9EURY|nr:MAG: hypothetical protein LAKADJCE_00362 [Candidatus Argoarchaeum ethanivorans]
MIECPLEVCISDINFRYDANIKVYPTLMSE